MATRSLNKVILIGNLTRDPELRYTPAGTAVCTFGVATNRSWTTQTGETKEDTEFHRIVSWNKLAELCSQLLAKGRKVYVEGRLSTHSWTAQDGTQRTSTEIVIEDMIILDSRRPIIKEEAVGEVPAGPVEKAPPVAETVVVSTAPKTAPTDDSKKVKKPRKEVEEKKVEEKEEVKSEVQSENITPEDIPF